MGTMDTLALQKEIKKIIGELGWSQKKLGREVYYGTFDDYDYDDEKEISRFEEKAKKDLNRPTTKIERLNEYLKIISHHREFKKLDIVLPVYRSNSELSEAMQKGMMDISEEIDQMLTIEEN